MADVAAAAGLARATLYRHFPTRDDLVAAIRAQAYDEAGAAIAACRLEEGPASDALRRLIEALVAVGDRYRFLQNEAEGEPAGAPRSKREDRLREPVLAMIQRGQANGEFARDLAPRWVARTLGALIPVCAARDRGGGAVLEGCSVDRLPHDLARPFERPFEKGLTGAYACACASGSGEPSWVTSGAS